MSQFENLKINYLILVLGIGLLFLTGCKKDEGGEISTTPEIEFVSVTPSIAKEYQDSLVFTISYKDGDGDLGENTPEAKNLYLTDSRNKVTYAYRVQELAPPNANIAIQGNIKVTLKNTAITDGANSQAVSFSIYMLDRSGNKSNIVNSTAVTIIK